MSTTIDDWIESGGSKRFVFRRAIVLNAELAALYRNWHCLILDISPRGAGVRLSGVQRLAIGVTSNLRLAEFGSIPAEVRRLETAFIGLRFLHRGAHDAEMVRWLELLNIK